MHNGVLIKLYKGNREALYELLILNSRKYC